MIRKVVDCSSFKTVLPVFASEGFLKTRSSDYGWLIDDRFVVPFIIDKRLVFSRLIFTAEPVSLEGPGDASYASFIDETSRFIGRSMSVDLIAKPQANVVLTATPTAAETIPWGSYRLPLNRFTTDDELMSIIHAKHRNVIRKAMKDGVSISQTRCDEPDVYQCLRETFERQKEVLYPSKGFLERLQRNLGDRVLTFRADYEGRLQGVAIVPFDDRAAYYYYGGSADAPYTGSLNLMHYGMIKTLKALGVGAYDFMGARIHVQKDSKSEGIQRFKSRFGGELVQGYTFRKVLRPLKYRMFEFSVRSYYRMKGAQYPGDFFAEQRQLADAASRNALLESDLAE